MFQPLSIKNDSNRDFVVVQNHEGTHLGNLLKDQTLKPKTCPHTESRLAPVTLASALGAPQTRNTPRKAKISASLKSINRSSAASMEKRLRGNPDKTLFLILSCRNVFLERRFS